MAGVDSGIADLIRNPEGKRPGKRHAEHLTIGITAGHDAHVILELIRNPEGKG